MSLKDLSKEQKQYVALGGLAAAILVILMVLGIRFSMATVSAAKEELDDLSGKISSANQALSKSKQTSEEYIETVTVLRKYMTNAPPERNYYSWATEVIYSTARFADLEVDSIDEISIPHRQRSAPDDVAAISFESYSLRITAHGGYENTKYFLNLINQDYPLVRFSGVEISSGQSKDEHDVQLFMQWPFNFGEISKNWDAVASQKIKIAELSAGEEVVDLKESEPEQEAAAPDPSITKPDAVREPYPPTTRPEVRETPAPKPAVEPAAPKTQPTMDAGDQVAPSSVDTAPTPATDEELQALLSYGAPPAAEMMDAASQGAITVSEPMEEPTPESELEPIVADPEPVMEPDVVSDDPDPTPMIELEEVPWNREFETHDSMPVPEEPQMDAMEAAPQMDSASAPEVDAAPQPSIGPQNISAVEEPPNDESTGISENNPEELLNEGSDDEEASLSSFLDDLMGETNEK